MAILKELAHMVVQKTHKKNNTKVGFSLLEILVAVGVFSVVATIAVGALLSLTTAQKKAFYIQTNQDNVRYALETMAREIRTGICYRDTATISGVVCPSRLSNIPANYYCSNPSYSGISEGCFQFVNGKNKDVIYKYAENVACKAGAGTFKCIVKSIDNGANFYPVTAREVNVIGLRFLAFGEETGLTDPPDNYQARVTIFLKAQTPGVSALNTELEVQTTISQLYPDKNL